MVELGQKVKDTLSGVKGTVVGRTEFLFGCVRVMIQPMGEKDGIPFDAFFVDEPQVEVIGKRSAPKVAPAHGPRMDAGRTPDATRR